MKDGVKMTGRLNFKLWDVDGTLILDRDIDNLIVNNGKAVMAGLLNGVVTDFFEHIAIGDQVSPTAESVGDTVLEQ